MAFVQRLLLAVAAIALTVKGQEDINSIECPVAVPGPDVTEELCLEHSACLWEDGVCHMRNNREAGYIYATDMEDTGRGFAGMISKADESLTLYGGDINQLMLEVIYHEDSHVQIKISDPANPRYEVPVPVSLPVEAGTEPLYQVTIGEQGNPVVLNVTRISNGNALLRQAGPITFEDQFIQMSFRLASPFLYGFGENPHPSLQHTFEPRITYPMFARDQPIGLGESNHYGVFPYYVNIEDDEGNTHSVLFMNSNAMEYSTFLMADGTPALTLRTIGGIIDLHVFAGPTPEDVNVQYATLVGKPAFPPYWSLGFQLSRWGYNSTEGVREVRDRMRAAGIPQDVQVFDIDYMDQRHDFTYDQNNFGDLPALIEELRNENIRTTLILDPAIAIDMSLNEPYSRGREAGAYIRWLSPDLVPDDQPEDADDFVVGHVWPNEDTAFPDFFLPNTKQWWSDEIAMFYEQVPFDALWIDMNEPANFGTNLDVGVTLTCPDNSLDSPPYPTKAANQDINESGRLSDKTICMSAGQSNGETAFTHYDAHSLYGYSEAVATFAALETLNPGKRPVVLSRSTFPGSGHYAVHWLGDNSATWDQMRLSIIGLIEFNLFGIPMVGADICGFFNEPTEELCARWMQLGAFYPFSRNHNTLGAADQDPAAWPSVAAISTEVLLLRYKFLPYLYTLFHAAHMRGSSVVRPLFNVFPADVPARAVDDQFMWADGLMVAPVVEEGAVGRTVYFPEGLWYDIQTEELAATGPASLEVDAPLEKIPVYVRGGAVLPFQEPALNTDESRLNDFGLVVALDEHRFASGEVFWDEGDEEHVMADTYLSSVLLAQDEFIMTVQYNRDAAAGINLATIRFLGFPAVPDGISVNGVDTDTYVYDEATQLLLLTLNVPLSDDLNILLNYQNP